MAELPRSTDASADPPRAAFAAGGANPAQLRRATRALMFGNFVMGNALWIVSGTLVDISESLDVSVSVAGQLITIAAITTCIGAPLMATVIGGCDRRRLLTLTMLWVGIGQLACALMPSYAALWPVRALAMLGAAVYTPQAGAAIGYMAPPGQRGRSISFLMMGWSVSAVFGTPLGSWIGGTAGWRAAFCVVGITGIVGAWLVHRSVPDGVKPPAMSASGWGEVLKNPVAMGTIAVTGMLCAGQFVMFAYVTPYYRFKLHASATEVSLLLLLFGAFCLVGILLVSRIIDRVGAGAVTFATAVISSVTMLLWPLPTTVIGMAFVAIVWGIGYSGIGSAQQVRLTQLAPAMTSATLALNTSCVYLGQASGAGTGGWIIARWGYEPLHWVSFCCFLSGALISAWMSRLALTHAPTRRLRERSLQGSESATTNLLP